MKLLEILKSHFCKDQNRLEIKRIYLDETLSAFNICGLKYNNVCLALIFAIVSMATAMFYFSVCLHFFKFEISVFASAVQNLLHTSIRNIDSNEILL